MAELVQVTSGSADGAHSRVPSYTDTLKSFIATLRKSVAKRKLLIAASKLLPGIYRIKVFGLPSGIEPSSQPTASRYQTSKIYPAKPVAAVVPIPIAEQFKNKYAGQFFPERIYPECTVISIQDGIANQNGFTVAPNGKLIPEACFEMGQWEERDYSILRRPRILPRIHYAADSIVALTSPWQSNYFHWLFDILPRVHLVERAGIEIERIYVETATNFQRETLDLLGFDKTRIINARDVEFVTTPNLIVPSLPAVPGIMPDWACEFLRERLMLPVAAHNDLVGKTKRARLYISRSRASRRKVANETELNILLADYGFTVVQLEDLSFLEQVALFRQAEIVVAVHGAGLANLVFCSPGTKVIEFHSPYWVNACYFDLSFQVSLNYHYIFGDDVLVANSRSSDEVTYDINIDLGQLEPLLASCLS